MIQDPLSWLLQGISSRQLSKDLPPGSSTLLALLEAVNRERL
jgi:hypothetical protein